MSENYVKVFQTMYTGSLYGAGMHVFAVWGWILAHKDESGVVEINPKLVANELGGTDQQVQETVNYLCAPDPNSRSTEEEGRRQKYRDRGQDRTEYWRDYKRKKRGKGVHVSTVDNVDNVDMSTDSTHAESEAESDADQSDIKSESDNHDPVAVPHEPDSDVIAAQGPDPDSPDRRCYCILVDVLGIEQSTDLTTLANFVKWLRDQIQAGKASRDAYNKAIAIAKDSVNGDCPIAVFTSRIKKQWGYVPPSKRKPSRMAYTQKSRKRP
jgi:hypothetical protein